MKCAECGLELVREWVPGKGFTLWARVQYFIVTHKMKVNGRWHEYFRRIEGKSAAEDVAAFLRHFGSKDINIEPEEDGGEVKADEPAMRTELERRIPDRAVPEDSNAGD
ncbi:hypothetical protein [Nonomuraea recticatena]|uniref:hypothetical protein n=1 Tax=Nonomuraea recticatena TaxID=46178 RepID=UPI0031F7F2BF